MTGIGAAPSRRSYPRLNASGDAACHFIHDEPALF